VDGVPAADENPWPWTENRARVLRGTAVRVGHASASPRGLLGALGACSWVPNTSFLVRFASMALARLLLDEPSPRGSRAMPRPIRMLNASEIFFVTVRCFQRGSFSVRPTETNEVLGGRTGTLGSHLHGVELFAFSVVSNHIHLVVRATTVRISPEFMQYLLTNVSKKVGRLVGWRGSFWGRRYSAEPILDENRIARACQIRALARREGGLVRRCRDWPGLSCLPLSARRASRGPFRWFDWARRSSGNAQRVARRSLDNRWAEPEELRPDPPSASCAARPPGSPCVSRTRRQSDRGTGFASVPDRPRKRPEY
jgi:REP element-mobilizing transposase RayT